MQVNTSSIQIERSQTFEEVEMYIPPHVNHKVAEIVIQGLYESQIRFLAELVANAQDANPGASPKVHFPTRWEPWFEVTDEGPGMSREFMRTRYCQIFDSTKDDDNTKIGGWGMGRLSALAVADSYQVTSRCGDHVDNYLVMRGENKMPRLVHLSDLPRGDQPTGVTVRVDVPADKIDQIEREASWLLGFYDPPLQCNRTIEPLQWEIRRPTWGLLQGHNQSNAVVMGGYPYPIALNQVLEYRSNPKTLDYQLQNTRGLVLFLPIGACDITTNRERLRYTDKTKAAVRAGLQVMTEDLAAAYQEEIDQCASTWDAMVYLNERMRWSELMPSMTYKGQPLKGRLDLKFAAITPASDRSGRFKLGTKTNTIFAIYPKSDMQLFVPDPQVRNPVARIRTHGRLGLDFYLTEHFSFDGAPIQSIAALDDPSTYRTTSKRKVSLKLVKYRDDTPCDISIDPNVPQVYVDLTSNIITGVPSFWELHDSRFRTSPVIGIPATRKSEKLVKNWTHFKDHVLANLQVAIDDPDFLTELSIYRTWCSLPETSKKIISLVDRCGRYPVGSLADRLVDFLNKSVNRRETEETANVASMLNVTLPTVKPLKIQALIDKLVAQRPLLPYLAVKGGYLTDEELTLLHGYITNR